MPEGMRNNDGGRPEELRGLLEERKEAARTELDDLSRRMRERSLSDVLDEGDRASQGFEQTVETTRANQLTDLLAQIDEALVRQTRNEYGRCSVCGEEIPLPRLKALPFVQTCRDCQEALEVRR